VGVIGKLFDAFVKGTNPGQPDTIGLGLFVSRDLAIRMGGALSYSYEDGKVMFSLSLPSVDPFRALPVSPILPPESLVA
jgi:signal transduction histidine kinase